MFIHVPTDVELYKCVKPWVAGVKEFDAKFRETGNPEVFHETKNELKDNLRIKFGNFESYLQNYAYRHDWKQTPYEPFLGRARVFTIDLMQSRGPALWGGMKDGVLI